MRLETNEYEASHGKKPRGFGLWWFEINNEYHSVTGVYGAAIRQAAKIAKATGATVVRVLP